jgi:osmoprotectant transport system permease protein
MNSFVNQVQLGWDWLVASGQWHGSDSIPLRVAQHLEYAGISLAVAIVIALPLGLLIGHTGRGGFVVVGFANVARALPTLGLVVLIVSLSGGLKLSLVLIALIVLAIPPILVNTYEGVRGVDDDIRDAAKGMGMTGFEVLRKAEAPVALPLILLGLRTSALQVVATVTVIAYPGFGGLGRFIIDGLAANNYSPVIGGSVIVVLLAIIVMLVFAGIRRFFISPGLRGSARTS